MIHDVLNGTRDQHLPAFVATFRPQINNMICGLYHIQIMFNHNDGVTSFNQLFQNFNQVVDISKMKASRWFVQDIQGTPSGPFPEFS